MSYEASAHKAQMAILRHLLLSPAAGFAELQKRTELTSDHFNFHIRKLIEVGYVEKREDGQYVLTRVGKEYANRMDTDDHVMEKQPKVSVALIIENDEGKFLAQQRLKQPYYGFWGRPTGKVRWGERLEEAAARELLEETGLRVDLEVKGFYHKIDRDIDTDELLEDKYFIIVYGKNPRGQLIEKDEGHINAWMTDEELLAQPTKFDSITEITGFAKRDEIGYIEEIQRYSKEEY
jgi:ADP-ribose pyrophosphatase YjhB (NUDIX family)